MIFGEGERIKMSDEYQITQQGYRQSISSEQQDNIHSKDYGCEFDYGKTFEFTSTALNEIDARKNAADQVLNFTRNAQ
jgi:hypothetical protein